jgi:uncharacterized protein with ATP-grasp and redox domains
MSIRLAEKAGAEQDFASREKYVAQAAELDQQAKLKQLSAVSTLYGGVLKNKELAELAKARLADSSARREDVRTRDEALAFQRYLELQRKEAADAETARRNRVQEAQKALDSFNKSVDFQIQQNVARYEKKGPKEFEEYLKKNPAAERYVRTRKRLEAELERASGGGESPSGGAQQSPTKPLSAFEKP